MAKPRLGLVSLSLVEKVARVLLINQSEGKQNQNKRELLSTLKKKTLIRNRKECQIALTEGNLPHPKT